MSIGAQALANAKMSAQQRAMQKVGGGVGVGQAGTPSMSGMAGAAMNAAQIQAMQRAATTRANRAAMANPMVGNAPTPNYSQADLDALLAFQQEMSQLSVAASAGDPSARARLEAWQALALKYQPEAQRLSAATGAGDMGAAQKLQRLQFDMMKEWTRTGSTKATKKIK
jgi:hypothetical protein